MTALAILAVVLPIWLFAFLFQLVVPLVTPREAAKAANWFIGVILSIVALVFSVSWGLSQLVGK